jgi:hypothetical protein
MKRVVASLVTLVAVVACGAVPTTGGGGGNLTVSQLKFKVLDQVGPVAYCDPDFYPIARDGGEQASALAMFDKIRADAEVYNAILEHEHLPSGDLTDAQKLTLYRAYKKLRALMLTASGAGYSFHYTATSSGYVDVAGTVSNSGTVSVASRNPGHAPMCPICLAASTLISTPSGPVAVTKVVVGMLVWTQAADGSLVAVPVLAVGSTPVPSTHLMVHLRLADGRELWASPGHRTADGRQLGTLAVGDTVDGSRVTFWTLEPYAGGRTYDLLPSGPTGTYWANGILLASTLSH